MKRIISLFLKSLDDIFLSLCVALSSLSLMCIILKAESYSSIAFKICVIVLSLWLLLRFAKIVLLKQTKKLILDNRFILLLLSLVIIVLSFIINYFRFWFPLTANSLSFVLLTICFNVVLYLCVTGTFSRKSVCCCVLLSFVLTLISVLCFLSGIARTWSGLKSGAGLTLNFSNPNLTGIFLSVVIFLNLFGIFLFKNIILKMSSLVFAALDFFLLVLTSARTPFIAVFAAFVFLVIFFSVRKPQKNRIISLIVAGMPIILASIYIIVVVIFTPDGVINDGGIGKSIFSRYDIWIEGFSFIGNDATNFLIGDYAHSMGNGHNSLITIWQQYGLIAMIVEILFVWQLLFSLYKTTNYRCKSQRIGFAFMLSFWFIGLFEASPVISSNGMFAFFGLSIVLNKQPLCKCLLMEQDNYKQTTFGNNVLLISNVYSYGSIGSIVKDIHLSNMSKGINSYVVYGRGEQCDDDKNVVSIENIFEVFFTKTIRRLLNNQYYGNFFMTEEIINTIKVLKPSVIHIHAFNDDFVNFKKLLSFLAKLKNTKIIYTHHSEYMYNGICGAHCYDCSQFINGDCLDCETFDKEAAKKMFLVKKTLFDNLSDSNFSTTSVSPWLHERVNLSAIFKKHNDKVVLNGSNIYKFINNQQPKKSKYILYVSPSIDNKQKRFDDFLKIAELNNNLKFKVLTLKESSLYSNTHNVTILSGISDKKVLAKYYSEALLTILTGSKETFSMPLIESLLCGTPVVCYKCGGPESLLIKDFASFVKNGDVQLLNKEMHEMLKKDFNPCDVAAYALNRFTADKMCAEYQKMYFESLDSFEINI